MPIGQVLEPCLRQLRERCAPLLGLPPWRGTMGSTLLQDARYAHGFVFGLLLSQWLLIMGLLATQSFSQTSGPGIRLASLVWKLVVAVATGVPVLAWFSRSPWRKELSSRLLQTEAGDTGEADDLPSSAVDAPRKVRLSDRERTLQRKLVVALAGERLRVVYQPLFSGGQAVTATEALARWNDPEEGEISPAEFIPIAEASGLISALSTYVMRKACAQMKEWQALGYPMQRVAVNVSVVQICRGDFFTSVLAILHETKLPPRCLELEVTESVFAQDFRAVKQTLQALRGLGVRISIDDFGTGYSSFGRLRELDADVLKIDKVFVEDAADSPNGRALVQAMIEMAHTLRLTVVAEGVETQRQLEMLCSMHCDEVQGFLLSRPHSPEMLTPLFRSECAKKEAVQAKAQLRTRTAQSLFAMPSKR